MIKPRNRRYKNPIDAFMARHVVLGNGCWQWIGSVDRGGYGVIATRPGKSVKAHRFSYEIHTGNQIPDGLSIDHLCRNRSCVNPDHLEPVTNRENVIRGNRARLSEDKCTHGHDGAWLYINSRGYRECRMCNRQTVKRYEQRKRAKTNLYNEEAAQ